MRIDLDTLSKQGEGDTVIIHVAVHRIVRVDMECARLGVILVDKSRISIDCCGV